LPIGYTDLKCSETAKSLLVHIFSENLSMKSNEQSIKEGNEMSIEQNLERIANGVEELVKLAKSNPAPVALGRPKSQVAAPSAAPAPAPDVDPITGAPVAVVTQEQLHEKLQDYMGKFQIEGPEGVKAIMIKHGANKAKPTITSIPPANYSALVKEIEEKLKGK